MSVTRLPDCLTGPAAAAHLELDGFRNLGWPSLWCVPKSRRGRPGAIATRNWLEPIYRDEFVCAHPLLIIRHLGELESHLELPSESLSARDRIELALEHALRDGIVDLAELSRCVQKSRARGDELVREILLLRGDEPPAESYAEVRMIQWLRSLQIPIWRQVPVVESGRVKHRVDALIPFDGRTARPTFVTPESGLIVELDSKEFHEGAFERDHERQTTYDKLGLAWISFTPNQLERSIGRATAALERRLKSARAAAAPVERGSGKSRTRTQTRNSRPYGAT